MSKENWIDKSRAAIERLYTEDPNNDNVIILGALLTILNSSDNTAALEHLDTSPEMSVSPPLLYVAEELKDAQKYISAGENDIAHDELRHAAYFIDKARLLAYTKEEQAMIRDYQKKHDLIAQSIEI